MGWALLSSACFGASFYGLEGVGQSLGPAWPIAGFRLVAVPVLYPLLRARGEPLAITGGHGARLFAVVVLDSAGLVIYTAGTHVGYVGLVAVLASLFAAVTIVLALVVLRERLTAWQWVGVVMILAGVGLVTSAG